MRLCISLEFKLDSDRYIDGSIELGLLDGEIIGAILKEYPEMDMTDRVGIGTSLPNWNFVIVGHAVWTIFQ